MTTTQPKRDNYCWWLTPYNGRCGKQEEDHFGLRECHRFVPPPAGQLNSLAAETAAPSEQGEHDDEVGKTDVRSDVQPANPANGVAGSDHAQTRDKAVVTGAALEPESAETFERSNYMWAVVISTKGEEKVSKGSSYSDAYRSYEKQAKQINAVNKNGEYLHPDVRISLRRI